nr:DUF6447 family protein [Marivita lacus]
MDHRFPSTNPKKEISMPMIKIDGTDYDTETLSEAAKAQLMNLQVVDQKIAATQQELAIQQTARNAYAQALQAELAKQN